MIRLSLFLIMIFASTPLAWAEDDFDRRLLLAKEMLDIRPARQQLENAVDSYINNYMFTQSEKDQQAVRSALLSKVNAKALEKLSVDAYAEIFTLQELKAMVEYYSKAEARSAADKQSLLSQRIAPEIVRMLDQAIMRSRTQTQTP